MTSKRNKPEGSSARKRPQANQQESLAKRQHLFGRLSTTSNLNESIETERMIEETYSTSGLFRLNKKDMKSNRLLEQLQTIPQNPTPIKHNIDLKIVKESDTQRKYLASIIDYLRTTKYDGPEPSNIRSLNTGQFHSMFNHLIKRIMPNHIPKNKFEDEVLEVIRELNYPLVNMISPTSLRSIGALHTNPAFFALLYWLTEYCKTADKARSIESSKYNLEYDNLFETYSVECFTTFVNGSEDFSTPNRKLNHLGENIIKEKQKELSAINTSILSIDAESDLIDRENDSLQQERLRRDELNRDLMKYQENIAKKKQRIEKDYGINKRLRDELERLRKVNASMDQEINIIIQNLAARNQTFEMIKEIDSEHTDLENNIHQITEKFTETEKENKLLESKLNELREKLEYDIKEYNANLLDDMVPLKYNSEATTIEEMLNINIEKDIKPQLELMETRAINEGNKVLEDTQEERRKASTIEEKSHELDKELNGLKKTLHRKKILVKQRREAEQKKQEDFNVSKENNEKRRFQLQEQSTFKLRNTQKTLEDRKIKVFESEQRIRELKSTVETKLDKLSTEIIEGVKTMKLTEEEHEQALISKVQKSLAKFK